MCIPFYLGTLSGSIKGTVVIEPNINMTALPVWYFASAILLIFFLLEAVIRRRRNWCLPALAIYGMTGVWYLVEAFYFPDRFNYFRHSAVEAAYLQVFLFLIFYRLITPVISRLSIDRSARTEIANIPAEKFLHYLIGIWLILLAFGIYRMNGDVFGALFPMEGRAGYSMWRRGRLGEAASFGFVISSASYIYSLACAAFLVLLPFQRTRKYRLLILLLVVLSFPYFILMGSRNQFLAVLMPGIFSYLLFSRQLWITKFLILAVLLVGVDLAFRIVIGYRGTGYSGVLSSGAAGIAVAYGYAHRGLDMASELVHINQFYDAGMLHLSYGKRYLDELLNFIPRAIWSNKPQIGLDYAILRGYARAYGFGSNAVTATISTGFIGQGFVNFGPVFGPIAAAFLMSIWTGFLARLWTQRSSILRLFLFLLGLGLTFNLGRDITLLVLWPMVFAYLLVRLIEHRRYKIARNARIRRKFLTSILTRDINR